MTNRYLPAIVAAKGARIAELEAEVERLTDLIRWAHNTLYEINPSNYDHDEVCKLNDASVEVILGIANHLGERHGKTDAWWKEHLETSTVPRSEALSRTGAVKALEWTKLSTGWIAHTPFHAYEVVATDHGFMATYANRDFAWGEEETMKHAAQADYERRILSALEPADLEGWQEAVRIGDAVLDWMVKFDLLDAGNEYCASDVLAVLNDLTPSTRHSEQVVTEAWRVITEYDQPPRDIPVLMGCWEKWPRDEWVVEYGLYGSTKGGWIHGRMTHWLPSDYLPPAPALKAAMEAGG